MPGDTHPSLPPPGPASAGPWRLEGEAARGGGGAVYRARHADGRIAAVKILARSLADHPAARARFAREIATTRGLGHANVVTLFDDGLLDDGRPWFAMEWLPGGTLAERLRGGRLEADELLAVVDGVAAGLAAAHAAGVVHRDLKPSNVMLVSPPGTPFTAADVRLVDFGVAFLADEERLTSTGVEVGTPASMSPEQRAAQPVGPASDVWAFAVLVHELITGEAAVLPPGAPPPPRLSAALPPALEAVLARCLAADPAARGDVAGAALALRSVLEGGAGASRAVAGSAPAIALALEGPSLAQPATAAELRRRCEQAQLQIVFAAPGRLVAARILGEDPERTRVAVTAARAALERGLVDPADRVRQHEAEATTLTLDGHTVILGGDLLRLETWPAEPDRIPAP